MLWFVAFKKTNNWTKSWICFQRSSWLQRKPTLFRFTLHYLLLHLHCSMASDHYFTASSCSEHCVTRDTGTKQWPKGALLGSLRGAGTPQGRPPSRYLIREGRGAPTQSWVVFESTSAQRCVAHSPLLVAVLALDMESRVLLEVVLLQIEQQQGKPERGKEDSFVLHLV